MKKNDKEQKQHNKAIQLHIKHEMDAQRLMLWL